MASKLCRTGEMPEAEKIGGWLVPKSGIASFVLSTGRSISDASRRELFAGDVKTNPHLVAAPQPNVEQVLKDSIKLRKIEQREPRKIDTKATRVNISRGKGREVRTRCTDLGWKLIERTGEKYPLVIVQNQRSNLLCTDLDEVEWCCQMAEDGKQRRGR